MGADAAADGIGQSLLMHLQQPPIDAGGNVEVELDVQLCTSRPPRRAGNAYGDPSVLSITILHGAGGNEEAELDVQLLRVAAFKEDWECLAENAECAIPEEPADLSTSARIPQQVRQGHAMAFAAVFSSVLREDTSCKPRFA